MFVPLGGGPGASPHIASLMLASIPRPPGAGLEQVPPRMVRAYAWIGHTLFTHPSGEALPCLHSRPAVVGVPGRPGGSVVKERPDLIICDYRLANGQSGIAAIAGLRKVYGAPVPAFLMSGDIAPERPREARESGHHLLHKPLGAMALRAMINRLLRSSSVAGAA